MTASRIVQVNWYGFNHKEVDKKFEGGLTYCNTFCVNGEYEPVAVYKTKNPNKKKGHKKYMLLQRSGNNGTIRGMTPTEMKKWRIQEAVECLKCLDIVYSVQRHDYAKCGCNAVGIDGGKDYTKVSHTGNGHRMVKIDLITNKVIKK